MRFYLIIFLFFSFSFICKAQNYTIYLGSGENCKGYDICSIAPLKSYSKNNNLLIEIGVTKEAKIYMDFYKESISDQELLFYFSTGFFFLKNNYILDDLLCKSLSIESCRIKKGKYTIKNETDFFRVQF